MESAAYVGNQDGFFGVLLHAFLPQLRSRFGYSGIFRLSVVTSKGEGYILILYHILPVADG